MRRHRRRLLGDICDDSLPLLGGIEFGRLVAGSLIRLGRPLDVEQRQCRTGLACGELGARFDRGWGVRTAADQHDDIPDRVASGLNEGHLTRCPRHDLIKIRSEDVLPAGPLCIPAEQHLVSTLLVDNVKDGTPDVVADDRTGADTDLEPFGTIASLCEHFPLAFDPLFLELNLI